MSEGKLNFSVFGAFSVTSPNGTDVTPSSLKAQALLAMLLTSENHKKRTRTWLQDKLWSRATAHNSSTSLRQELRTIRKFFGNFSIVVQSNRTAVWLNEELLHSDLLDNESPDWCRFLEGLNVDDPEFNDWLSYRRNLSPNEASSAQSSLQSVPGLATPSFERAKRWKISIAPNPATSLSGRFVEADFISLFVRSVSENGLADVQEAPCDPEDPCAFEVRLSTNPVSEQRFNLRVTAIHTRTKRVLWSGTKLIDSNIRGAAADLPQIVLTNMVQSAIVREISFGAKDNQLISYNAQVLSRVTPRIFSFEARELNSVYNELGQINDGPELALARGWQAQIDVIRDVEELSDTPEEVIEQGLSCAAYALEANAMNSLVLSSAANAHIFLDLGIDASAELAKLAVRVNPSNPLAWWSYANVSLYLDQSEQALRSSKIAAQLSENTHLQFWCKFQLGLAALQCGDFDLAMRSLEASAAIAPRFRPPRRYLLALYTHLGQRDRARRMVYELEKLEVHFTLDRYSRDDAYPVSLARRLNLIDTAAISSLR